MESDDTTPDAPLGDNAASILATEHWSLLATRTLVWGEAANRVTTFLTVLSAATVALALLANGTGFGTETTVAALLGLPVVLFLGLATFVRLVDINAEEHHLTLAMNRLRAGYLRIEPGVEKYFSTGHHDDEIGVMATYQLSQRGELAWRSYFLINTPTIVATVDAALAAAIAVLALVAADASTAVRVVGGAAAFLVAWVGLLALQERSLRRVTAWTSRFPTPADGP